MKNTVLCIMAASALGLSCGAPKHTQQHNDRILYYGQDNKLSVPLQKGTIGEVTIDNGKLIRVNDTSYIVNPVAPITTINIRHGEKNKKHLYHTITIPAPYPMLIPDDNRQSTMRSAVMKESRSMATVIENFNFNCTFDVKSFNLIRIAKDNQVSRIDNVSRWFDCRPLAKKAENGDTFIIANIKVLHVESGNIITARDRVITITD